MPIPFDGNGGPAVVAGGRVGVIDIGSNSIRLVVYDSLTRTPLPIFNEKVLCGLGRGVKRTGRLDPEGTRSALSNLARFKTLLDAMQVERYQALATAAVRDAGDGDAFIAAIQDRIGLKIRAIGGEEEARLSAQGVLSGIPGADGVVGDLGGGSLELVGLDRGLIGPLVTLPVGPLRLTELNQGRAGNLARLVDQHLERVAWVGDYRRRRFYPVGGGWRALARLHMEQSGYPLHVIHHYTMTGSECRDFAAQLARKDKAAIDRLPGGPRRRNETLALVALVLERTVKAIDPAEVVFSAFGLREGYLFGLLGAEQQRQDPLIGACKDFADRLGRFGAGDAMVSWTDGLFAGEDAPAARLRRAACLLSDLGWIEHPDYRPEHAFLRILRLPFAGLDHRERAFLALTAFIRYGGRLDDPLIQPTRGLVTESQIIKANILGLALRLALAMTGGVVGLLDRITLRLTGDRLVLTLPIDLAPLAADVVQRRLDALAKSLNRTAEIAAGPGG